MADGPLDGDFRRRVEDRLFKAPLGPDQVAGIAHILDAFAADGDGSEKTLAYALATAFHETGRVMLPVREGFAKTDADARRRVHARPYGRPSGPHGHVYYGRGQVQLTWEENYRRASADAGCDLVAEPDRALDPAIGARILIRGLIDGRWNGGPGAHAGKGIAHYLPPSGPDDVRNARRTVNVLDRWWLIAGHYVRFLAAIRRSGLIGRAATASTGDGC